MLFRTSVFVIFVVLVSLHFLCRWLLLYVGWLDFMVLLGRVFLLCGGLRGLEFVGLLHFCVMCFHQTGMIASKKLRHPYLFAALIAPEPCVLACVCSVS